MQSLEASFTKYLVLQGNNPIVFNRDQLNTISFALLFQSMLYMGDLGLALWLSGELLWKSL